MPVRVRVTPFANTVKLILDARLSPKERSERVAAFASVRIAKADEINRRALGSTPPKTITVDGREGAPLNSVNPDRGIIIAEWHLIGEALMWIMATLRERSPVISGDYKRFHTMYADGIEVSDISEPPMASEYTFLNHVPYTRKIEIGKVKGPPPRDFVVQVPNRIYERTADDAKARFGNLAKIRFTYGSPVGATPINKWAASSSAQRLARRSGRRTKSTEWLTRQPAITVTLR